MSDQDVKLAGNSTGTFPVIRPTTPDTGAGGKSAPQNGNDLPAKQIDDADLEALAAKLNIQSQSIGRDLRFKVDMDSGKSVIQVLDRETGEIIREIPPEKAEVSLSVNGDMRLRLYDGRA